jgi:ATPase family AAA domain-containing protein 2
MDLWFRTISDAARETFMTLVRGISPSDPILLLGLVESPLSQVDSDLRAMFGYSLQNRVEVASPAHESRYEYFKNALGNLDKAPSDFPDAIKRRIRVLEILEKAPPPPPKIWTKLELEEQALKDRQTQNGIKLKLSGLMDLLKKRYQRFRKSIIVDPSF